MNWLRAIWAEFLGLFVDDVLLAAGALIWIGLCWAVLPRLFLLPPAVPPILLFAGFVAVLVLSAVRGAGGGR